MAIDGISARKTKRAERVKGFEQAPDFIVPDEFNPRIEDMKKLLIATRGKVFTLQTIPQMVQYTRLREFATE